MKKLVGIIFYLLILIPAFAQRPKVKNLTTFDDKKLHFGFTIAINTLDFGLEHWTPIGNNPAFDVTDSNIPVDSRYQGELPVLATDTVRSDIKTLVPGLTVSIVSNLRLGEYFDLRFLPGLSFGERRLIYNVPIYDNNSVEIIDEYFSVKTTYIDLPLLLKYKSSRVNNQRPYLIAGPAFRVDISKTGVEDLIRVKRGGFYIEGGVGWDTYLRFFKLSVELKASLGIGNKLNEAGQDQRAYYTHAIKELTSNVFTLSFHFE
ncbi:type IX secretion/gliding motility protein PorT/SprT [Sunxiuqinia sp. A32]|uniref:type IX secretion/gliding motility protein PorT/SprT n=1 Tax=Sunxiuqinia sp. A32 TaxID=3461496 RepID=UPI004046148A